MIDEKLLELLACPACDDRPPVRLEGDKLICDQCHRAYPIRDGIPEMLVESAETLDSSSAPDRES
jgi:uncharacterized protein YbaR (Trm112 family)